MNFIYQDTGLWQATINSLLFPGLYWPLMTLVPTLHQVSSLNVKQPQDVV